MPADTGAFERTGQALGVTGYDLSFNCRGAVSIMGTGDIRARRIAVWSGRFCETVWICKQWPKLKLSFSPKRTGA